MTCTPRRPDLMLEHQNEQQLLTADTACPNEANITENKLKKIPKYQKLKELLERRPRFMGKVAPLVIGCLGRGMKQFEEDIRDLFDEKETFKIADKIQKTVSWERESIVRRVMSGLMK